METAVIHLPCVQFLVCCRVEDTHDILFCDSDRRGYRADKEVQVLCGCSFFISAFFLATIFTVIDLDSCVHTVGRCGNQRYTIYRRNLCLNSTFREGHCSDLACKFQLQFHNKFRCCLADKSSVIVFSYRFDPFFQLTQSRCRSSSRYIRFSDHSCFICSECFCSQLADTVRIDLRNYLRPLELSHNCTSCRDKVRFINVHRINLEQTATVLCHFSCFVLQGNGTVLISILTVIVTHSLNVHFRDLYLGTAVIDHLTGIGIHPAGGCFPDSDLIKLCHE